MLSSGWRVRVQILVDDSPGSASAWSLTVPTALRVWCANGTECAPDAILAWQEERRRQNLPSGNYFRFIKGNVILRGLKILVFTFGIILAERSIGSAS